MLCNAHQLEKNNIEFECEVTNVSPLEHKISITTKAHPFGAKPFI